MTWNLNEGGLGLLPDGHARFIKFASFAFMMGILESGDSFLFALDVPVLSRIGPANSIFLVDRVRQHLTSKTEKPCELSVYTESAVAALYLVAKSHVALEIERSKRSETGTAILDDSPFLLLAVRALQDHGFAISPQADLEQWGDAIDYLSDVILHDDDWAIDSEDLAPKELASLCEDLGIEREYFTGEAPKPPSADELFESMRKIFSKT